MVTEKIIRLPKNCGRNPAVVEVGEALKWGTSCAILDFVV